MSVVTVLATGPSMSQQIADFVRGKCKVVAVSDAYKIAPYADAIVSNDAAWWRVHPQAMKLPGRKFCAGIHVGTERLRGTAEFSTGLNSGLQGVRVARDELGGRKILLSGFDLSAANGQHFFGLHPAPLKNTAPERFAEMIAQFERVQMRPDVRIINCTPGSALTRFEFSTLETELLMPADATQRFSLAYRKARDEIRSGRVPDKYRRLLQHIKGKTVLELGSAEGVLAALLLRERRAERVIALELRQERHLEALSLHSKWRKMGFINGGLQLEQGDIRNRLELLDGVDTLVAVRSIYYLRSDAPEVMAKVAAAGVSRVVLCGNKGRAEQHKLAPQTEEGQFNRLASIAGMRELLEGSGFIIKKVVSDGDPIVIGAR